MANPAPCVLSMHLSHGVGGRRLHCLDGARPRLACRCGKGQAALAAHARAGHGGRSIPACRTPRAGGSARRLRSRCTGTTMSSPMCFRPSISSRRPSIRRHFFDVIGGVDLERSYHRVAQRWCSTSEPYDPSRGRGASACSILSWPAKPASRCAAAPMLLPPDYSCHRCDGQHAFHAARRPLASPRGLCCARGSPEPRLTAAALVATAPAPTSMAESQSKSWDALLASRRRGAPAAHLGRGGGSARGRGRGGRMRSSRRAPLGKPELSDPI